MINVVRHNFASLYEIPHTLSLIRPYNDHISPSVPQTEDNDNDDAPRTTTELTEKVGNSFSVSLGVSVGGVRISLDGAERCMFLFCGCSSGRRRV